MKLKEYLRSGKTYIIAEMSGNHGGSLEKALEIVRAAAAAGADCLKTQTYTADTITINAHTPPFKLEGGLWDDRYLYDLYIEGYTPWEWMQPIKEETERLGMDFLSTPFDDTAVDYLEGIGEEFYKIASFEMVDLPLIRKAASTGKPLVISCGMASEEEIREALETAQRTLESVNGKCERGDVVLLKCCSAYPTAYPTLHLKTITDMKERFGVPIGLSDHSAGSLPEIAAVALGASVIEKHICISKKDNTVDSDFSLSKEEFAQMVRDVRDAEAALGAVSYGPSDDEMSMYALRRSLYAVKDIRKGEIFTKENVRSVRPAGGLHTRYYDRLIGAASCSNEDGAEGKLSPMHAARDIPFGTPLSEQDIAEKL